MSRRQAAADRNARAGCRVPPNAVVRLVQTGLAFPGTGKLERARILRSGGYYLAARILAPGADTSVGIGVWVLSDLSKGAAVVAVNKKAAAYSDWRRADAPLSAVARRAVLRTQRCMP
ncbi:MAG: hypothetical protein ACJ757_12345 [Gaiellaceae bacterium]